MQRRWSRIELFLLLPLACSAPESETRAVEPSAERPPGSPPAVREPIVPAKPGLPRRALDLAAHGKPLDALRLLLEETRQRVAATSWDDEMLVAESVVAAAVLESLLDETAAWLEAAQGLQRAKPFPPQTPPELATALDFVLARALIRTLRVAEARQLARAQGVLTDWRIVGSFPNERGGGFDSVYPPEEKVDLAAPMRVKERDLSWRPNPARGQPLGVVVLDEMLRPNEQSVAYLTTALRVERPHEVVLRLGSSGALKVWHDGTLALAHDVQRPFHRDQDRIVLALQPGWNRLLLKVGVEEQEPWLVAARVTELDGRPVPDLTCSSGHAEDATNPAPKSTATPARSARDILEARAGEPEAVRLLALYHLSIHPDDKADHTARKQAERVALLEPDDLAGLYLLARANEPGRGAKTEEVSHNERLFALKRLIELDPSHVAALLDLAEFSMHQSPLPRRADELSARALAAAPQHWRALRVRSQVLENDYRAAESERIHEDAGVSAEALLQPAYIVASALRRRLRGDLDGELALLAQAVRGGSGERDVVDALVQAHIERGDVEAAIAVTDAWLERAPFDVGRLLATERLVEYAGHTDAARELVERALTISPDDAQAHFVMARLAQRDGDLLAADRELAEVLRLDQGYEKARRQRQLLASQVQDRFEEPYRWDALTRVGTVAHQSGENDRVQVVDRTTVWRVNSDGTEHRYEHELLQVENSGGVKDLDEYWIPYPYDATLQVYNVRVVHPDGTFERAPAPRRGDSDSGRERLRPFDLPPLEVGDCVDIEYRIDQTQADVFGQYFGTRHVFYADSPDPLAPVARAELVVISPQEVPIYAVEQNGQELEKSVATDAHGFLVHRWVARGLKRPAMQAAMPDRSEYAPLVDVSTFASWEAFASWWWNFIEKEFTTTPAMKQKVAELTAGLTSEHDKVRAITRFAGQEIRYNAWPFGTHGYEPYSAATIFERRFGDCKDKSILLRQMLAEIGVDAHPVLIHARYLRPAERLDVAMVGHFNHCIAYVPATSEREGYYLDATADRDPLEYLRADDQGAQVLHVRDGHGSIHEVPYAPPGENALEREYEVALDRQGGGEVHLIDTSNGSFGVGIRYQFGGEQGNLQKRVAEAMSEPFGKVDVSAARTSDLEDIGQPVRLEVELKATNLWSRDASGANLRLGFDDIPILHVATEPAEEREWDLVLDRPFSMATRIVYLLPDGVRIAELPPDATIAAPGLVDYSLVARQTGDGVEVRRRFTLHERRIGLEHYAAFQGALREIQLAEARTIVLAVEGGTDSGRNEEK